MSARLRRWGLRLGVVALGAVGALGFAPLHIWPATLLALAGLYARIRAVAAQGRPGRTAFATGLLFGLGWFSASCFWIASAFFERGPEFIPLIPPLVGGLAVLLSLFWGAAAALGARVMHRGAAWVGPLVFAGSFGLAELARGHVMSGFPWNMAVYAFEPGGWVSQLAAWVGVYGLTTLILLVAALFGEAAMRRSWRPGAGGTALLAGMGVLGALRLSGAPAPDAHPVQPGVVMRLVSVPFRQSDKLDPASSFGVIERFIAQSVEPGIASVSHLVWPEGAVNGLAVDNEPLLRAVGAELAFQDATPPVWLLTSLRQEVSPHPRTGEPRPRYYNSAVAVGFDAAGNPAVLGTDDKRKLVPFGEFIPGGEIVERLGARLVSTALGSITGAPRKRVARFPGLPPASVQICYEVIFPGLIRQTGGDAPELILNQSNDAWFGPTVGPAQHAAIARYRTIEEGLPMVRAAANGVSGVFDPYGRTVAELPRDRAAHADVTVPLPVGGTVPTRLVNFAIVLINLCLVLLSAALGRRL